MSSTADSRIDESAIGAIDAAAGYCRTLWATFIGYAATLFVLASGTTHDALLRQTPVKLPLFNVESGIPLVLFYVIAPLLLVLFHLNLLLKLHDLRVRVRAVTRPLRGKDGEETRELRDRLRRRFTAFDYALLESGLVEWRESLLLRTVTSATIFLMPVLLLLFVQLQFLPYHDWRISGVQRALIVTDLILIAVIQLWLGRDGNVSAIPRARKWKAWFIPTSFPTARRTMSRVLSFAVPVLVSVFVLAFPGEPQDVFWETAWTLTQPVTDENETPNNFSALAGTDFAEKFGIRRSLYLADRSLWAAEPSEDLLQALTEDTTIIALRENVQGASPQLLRTVQRIRNAALTLRGRNLSYANFENAGLIAADFRPDLNNEQMRAFQRDSNNDDPKGNLTEPGNRTDMSGASFSGADLRGSRLSYVQAARADFYNAKLQNAAFDHARLQNANFSSAQSQNADFSWALLNNANLMEAGLQNADFGFARLPRTTLFRAQLHGAILIGAQLQGANLKSAQLPGALLFEAQLQGADLSDAEMQGADLTEAQLQGADLNRAQLLGANFESAQLQGADLSVAGLEGANLAGAALQGANLNAARLRGVDFTRALVRGANFDNADISLANFAGLNTGEDYDFDGWDRYEQELPDEARREIFRRNLADARARLSATGPALKPAYGDNVWATGPEILGDQVKRADAGNPAAYAASWASFVTDLACTAGRENNDNAAFAAGGIARRLAARALSLTLERDLGLRALGAALAQAELGNSCAKAMLSAETIEKLVEAARRAPPPTGQQ